jgi:hypothetical protein
MVAGRQNVKSLSAFHFLRSVQFSTTVNCVCALLGAWHCGQKAFPVAVTAGGLLKAPRVLKARE